jgi:hypothetical protein
MLHVLVNLLSAVADFIPWFPMLCMYVTRPVCSATLGGWGFLYKSSAKICTGDGSMPPRA